MKAWMIFGVGLALAGCAQTTTGTTATAITTTTGGAFGGSQSTTIFADDRVRVVTAGPFAEDNVPRETVIDGAYGRALAEVRRLLPVAVDGVDSELCPDYGTDSVKISPPINGKTGVSVGCPDADVSALIRAVNAAIAPVEPL